MHISTTGGCWGAGKCAGEGVVVSIKHFDFAATLMLLESLSGGNSSCAALGNVFCFALEVFFLLKSFFTASTSFCKLQNPFWVDLSVFPAFLHGTAAFLFGWQMLVKDDKNDLDVLGPAGPNFASPLALPVLEKDTSGSFVLFDAHILRAIVTPPCKYEPLTTV
jgi:hypothetical protein